MCRYDVTCHWTKDLQGSKRFARTNAVSWFKVSHSCNLYFYPFWLKKQYIEVHRKWPGTWNNYNDYFSLPFVFAVQPLQPVYMIWLAKCLNLRRILKVKFNARIIFTQPLCEGLNIQLYRILAQVPTSFRACMYPELFVYVHKSYWIIRKIILPNVL